MADASLVLMARDLAALPGFEKLTHQALLITCLGAVSILWITADAHLDQNDVLPFGPRHIEQLTGIDGIADILPEKWFQVIDAEHLKLPGYQEHRSSEARRKALGAARQRRYISKLSARQRQH